MELKRRRSRLVTMVMVLLLMSTYFASAAELKGTVIASEGIVRKSTSFNGEIVEKLNIGTSVNVLDFKDRWYHIKTLDGGLEGWIYEELMVVEDSTKTQKGITTASVLNVRQEPSTSGHVLSRLSQGSEVIIVSARGEWYQIKTQHINNGWVHSDFVKLIPNYPPGLVLRNADLKENRGSDEVVLSLRKDSRVYIKDFVEGWYLVVTDNFIEGWLPQLEVELEINITRPVSRSGERTGIFSNIAEVSKKYLGKKYGWGQTGPDRFDCSGFTTYILNTYYGDYLKSKGINLPRTSRDQATVGTNVNRGEWIPGDLVFFNTESRISSNITHVGIYLGNGQFIHASSARQTVMISSLSEGYYDTRYIKAVRF